MTADQWQRVRDLFERGLDHRSPTLDLDAWLAHEAADDPVVRAEAASLLEHHSRAGAFLSEGVVPRLSHLLDERSDEAARFDPGAVVGPYTIVREVGRGGMGRVYLATDTRLGRAVALKVLSPALTREPSQRERLRREARAAASLSHPNICTIYALEELDADVFIAAEFVDGHTLRDEIESGQRPSSTVLMASAQALADALACAHGRGITHRDLKPENVMRSREGRLKILDFGLARVETGVEGPDAARVTVTGAVIGTPAYMSPEQLKGERGDFRSDVFALGVLLYEYACGMHPFEAETPLALAARVLESDPRPLTSVRADVLPALASIIDRCLRKAPADRFQSAADIVEALARPDSGPVVGPATGWWRTHQTAALSLYFAAVAVAWRIKEWEHGVTDPAFLLVGVAAAIAGVFRGHLLFTERMNREAFEPERRRAEPVTLVIDLLIGLVLTLDGWLLAASRPVAGVLTIALGIGIALTRLVIERATERSAFGTRR